MKEKGNASDGEPRPERFAYTSPDQIRWVHKSEAHLAAEAALAAQQGAERDALKTKPQPAHPPR